MPKSKKKVKKEEELAEFLDKFGAKQVDWGGYFVPYGFLIDIHKYHIEREDKLAKELLAEVQSPNPSLLVIQNTLLKAIKSL